MKLTPHPSIRFLSPMALYLDIIDQLSGKHNPKVDVPDNSVDYQWIKDKVVEDVKGPIWTKLQAVLSLQELKDVSKVSNEDVATKLNEIIKALQA